jgi:ABC-2 type transport system permease protein
VLAAAQAIVVCAVGFGLLGLESPHGVLLVGALAILNALLGMALGLLLSAFARTEFQAVQFMPAFIFPQMLLCGLFITRDEMAPVLEAVSWLLPFTYAYDALDLAVSPGQLDATLMIDVVVVIGATMASLALGAVTLKRRTP